MDGKWWTHDGICLNACPPKFEEKDGKCILCKSLCPKVCNGSQITNIDLLQSFRGCTNITGALQIRIDHEIKDIESELEKNLGNIEEITEFLKIYRNIPLRNLTFLKSLRVIRGVKLDLHRYSLVVYDNSNLQKLWDWDNFNMTILNGTFSFHFNPKLCPSEIEKLANLSKLQTSYNYIDVSNHSNGDSFSCTYININVSVTYLTENNATLEWRPLTTPENKIATRYLVYYKEAINNDTDTEEEVCGEQSWMIEFAAFDDIDTSNLTKPFQTNLTRLKTYTRYAYYVRTDYRQGARSELNFFTTLSGNPSVPMNVRAESAGSNSIRLMWDRPININGELSHYSVIGFIQQEDQSFIDQRNYCKYKMIEEPPKQETVLETTTLATNSNICACEEQPKYMPTTLIQVEDFDALCTDLSTVTYNVSRGVQSYGCADFHYLVIPAHHKYSNLTVDNEADSTALATGTWPDVEQEHGLYRAFEKRVDPKATSFLIDSLKHYSIYVLLISACNENRTELEQCGGVVMVSQRTGRKANADHIEDILLSVIDVSNVEIRWREPEHPNAMIVSYEIEYKNMNNEKVKSVSECITRLSHQNAGYKYYIRNLHPGKYRVRVRATSLAGPGEFTPDKMFLITTRPQNTSYIAIITVVLILVVLVVVLVLYWRFRVRRSLDNVHLIANVNPDYAGYQVDEWEIERDSIEIYQELGQGTFGQVFSGIIKSTNMPCAIKTVNDKATMHDIMEFLNEACVMKAFNEAHHVVRLMGVVSKGPRPLVIMELMVRGDLKSFLRTTRDSSTSLTCSEMYRMAIEIADGMAYLAAKKFVHRDLAARNCMVAADRTVKIGDFGMTRDIYETDYYRKETRGLLPVRWMAPESLADGIFTSDSDIWSYGIVLWEIATLAEQPYQGLANEQVLQFVISKGTLERPLQCPDLMYDIMDACWHWFPHSRPMFIDIVEKLESHVGQDFRLVSFHHSRDGEDFRMNKSEINKARASHTSAMVQGQVAAHWARDAEEVRFHTEAVGRSPGPLSQSYQSSQNDYTPYPQPGTSVPRYGV